MGVFHDCEHHLSLTQQAFLIGLWKSGQTVSLPGVMGQYESVVYVLINDPIVGSMVIYFVKLGNVGTKLFVRCGGG